MTDRGIDGMGIDGVLIDGVVIGEGVMLDARPASFITRALGALLDALVVLASFLVIASAGFTVVDGGGQHWYGAMGISAMVIALVIVPSAIESLSRGRSLGKLATGIRIVRDDAGPVRFRHALIRALLGVLEIYLTMGGVAALVSMANARGKRLGDIAAGTYAIRIRGARDRKVDLVMPPELAVWAGTADMARLPDGLAVAARRFLDRAPRLAPTSRAQLSDELAARVERYVAPAPPLGTHPEAFLHAVLITRRDREMAVAIRRQAFAHQRALSQQSLPFTLGKARPS
ncbi:MAG: RDD family protein [Cellulomonadaceae bacterium]|jgi:uncharacterized RDD family membrane protein YckC|nr:RDD family protein [Cellulomonadaceae bacterium]